MSVERGTYKLLSKERAKVAQCIKDRAALQDRVDALTLENAGLKRENDDLKKLILIDHVDEMRGD